MLLKNETKARVKALGAAFGKGFRSTGFGRRDGRLYAIALTALLGLLLASVIEDVSPLQVVREISGWAEAFRGLCGLAGR